MILQVHQKTILKIHAHSKRTDIANRFLNNTFDSKRSLPLENPHPEDPTRPLTTASYYQQANIKQATAISKSEVDAVETSQESSKQNKTSAIRIGNQNFTENTQNNESSVSVKELAAEQSSNQTSDDNIRYEGVSVNANATENVSGEVNNSNVTNEAEKLVQNTAEDKNDNSKSDETDTADSDGEIGMYTKIYVIGGFKKYVDINCDIYNVIDDDFFFFFLFWSSFTNIHDSQDNR